MVRTAASRVEGDSGMMLSACFNLHGRLLLSVRGCMLCLAWLTAALRAGLRVECMLCLAWLTAALRAGLRVECMLCLALLTADLGDVEGVGTGNAAADIHGCVAAAHGRATAVDVFANRGICGPCALALGCARGTAVQEFGNLQAQRVDLFYQVTYGEPVPTCRHFFPAGKALERKCVCVRV